MSNPTRTASVSSGITEAGQTMLALLTAAGSIAKRTLLYAEMVIENLGDASLQVAVSDQGVTPTDSDYRTLATGSSMTLKNVSIENVYVRTTDDGAATNVFEIEGNY